MTSTEAMLALAELPQVVYISHDRKSDENHMLTGKQYANETGWAFPMGPDPKVHGVQTAAWIVVSEDPLVAGILYPQVAVTNDTLPYPNVRHYTFVWRHASSGLQGGDKMQIDIDDNGRFERECADYDPPMRNHCYTTSTWDPEFHVAVYVRVWRQLGSVISDQSSTASPNTSDVYVGNALCGTDMANQTSTASPCQAYQNNTTGITTFYNASTAVAIAGSE
jgi:hypothetical protein